MDVSEKYEEAMIAFQRRIYRTSDGLLAMDARDGREIGIADPVVFADLKRSMDETNNKIRRGEISLEAIVIGEG